VRSNKKHLLGLFFMNLIKSTGFWFLICVLVLGFFFVGYAKEDAFFVFSDFSNSLKDLSGSTSSAERVEVFFCPEENCALQLISQIDSAQESIYIAIYSFTLDEISEALLRAKERGVEVKVIFDYLQAANAYSEDEKLLGYGIPIRIKNGSGYMHNKFCIIDGEKVLTGSFNYSQNADTKNDENLILIISKEIAEAYLSEFNEIWEEAS
jgi:phosphatidylserine/phosphatidylglycerophosphate/cardiolipin synthase-like enzyme